MKVNEAIKKVQRNLSPELLQGRWKQQAHPLQGYCYVAAEALYHLLGDEWKPVYARYEDEKGRATHWWLENRTTKQIADPTREQFEPNQPPYDKGVGCAFLTQQPSRRAQIILDRIENETKARQKN